MNVDDSVLAEFQRVRDVVKQALEAIDEAMRDMMATAQERKKINRMLTVSKAAKLLGVHKNTLRSWDLSGKLKPIRNGARGFRYYSLTQVETFAKSGEDINTSTPPLAENTTDVTTDDAEEDFGGSGNQEENNA